VLAAVVSKMAIETSTKNFYFKMLKLPTSTKALLSHHHTLPLLSFFIRTEVSEFVILWKAKLKKGFWLLLKKNSNQFSLVLSLPQYIKIFKLNCFSTDLFPQINSRHKWEQPWTAQEVKAPHMPPRWWALSPPSGKNTGETWDKTIDAPKPVPAS